MQCIKVVVQDASLIKPIKTLLEKNGWLNRHHKIVKVDGRASIFTTISSDSKFQLSESLHDFDVVLDEYTVPRAEMGSGDEIVHVTSSVGAPDNGVANCQNPVLQIIHQYYQEHTLVYKQQLDQYVPKRWTIYHPMVLFNCNTFDSDLWCEELASIDSDSLFKYILQSHFPKLTHVAVNKPINKQSIMRIPLNILPLHGDFGPPITEQRFTRPTETDFHNAFWCTVNQNGIKQTWCPTYTMFSRGNIKEKKRILDSFKNLNRSYVIDMYAGIGYFSLSYLKNGATLLGWELNPWSTEALRRNCVLNNFKYDTTPIFNHSTQGYIFNDDNETSIDTVNSLLNNPQSLLISHINLGLLPSSQQSWGMAKHFASMSTLNTIIHIHENVHINEFESFRQHILQQFPGFTVIEITKVKTFAPDVWHVVFDIQKLS